MSRSLKVLVLFDVSSNLEDGEQDYSEHLKEDDWLTEANVINSLKRLGHEVIPFGLKGDILKLVHTLKTRQPDLVFNLGEAFNNERHFEPHIASFLELMNVKYTGATPEGLRLCKDKGLTKKILSFHRIHIPKFVTSRKSRPIKTLTKVPFPVFIKPLNLEASEGIAQLSFANSEKEALDRVRFIHESLQADAIIEEYIEGREIYVSILGNERLTHFPPRELFFSQVPDTEPKIATFQAKWNDDYRQKWGIYNGLARSIPPESIKKMAEICKKIYRLLKLRGYGRIDLRLRPNGDWVFLEANPNPSLARQDDFAQSAQKSGLTYDEIIARIISLSGAA